MASSGIVWIDVTFDWRVKRPKALIYIGYFEKGWWS